MDIGIPHPQECKKSVRRLMSATGMTTDTAYSMILMTAALMDLRTDDPQVVDIVLADCGIYPEKIS